MEIMLMNWKQDGELIEQVFTGEAGDLTTLARESFDFCNESSFFTTLGPESFVQIFSSDNH